MTEAVDHLLQEADRLSPAEREELVECLVERIRDDLSPEVSAAQLAEVRRRVAELESGEVVGIPGEEALAHVRGVVAARRGKTGVGFVEQSFKVSPKQEIYRELIRTSLIYIRNQQNWHVRAPFWRRWRDRSASEETELIHNLWPSLFEPEFGPHDLWFLNWQAASYCTQARFSPLFDQHVALIRELFELVPAELRGQLRWEGP